MTLTIDYVNISLYDFLVETNKMTDNLKTKQNIITIRDLLGIMLKKWYVVIAFCLVSMIAAAVITVAFITPMYTSTAKLYIKNKETTVINANEISVSSYLTKDYEEIIVDRSILEEVIETLSLDISYNKLKSVVETYNPDKTRFIEITVEYSDPKVAKDIVDCICKITQNKIVNVIDIDRVIVFSEGNLSKGPTSPNLVLNIIKGFIIGIALSSAFALILHFKDDKINTSEDVEKYLEINVLSCVPYSDRSQSKKR